MSISVRTSEDVFNYPNGEKWHIDEDGRLHVLYPSGKHLAAYAQGQWLSVEQKTNAPEVQVQHVGFTDSAGDVAVQTARALRASRSI